MTIYSARCICHRQSIRCRSGLSCQRHVYLYFGQCTNYVHISQNDCSFRFESIGIFQRIGEFFIRCMRNRYIGRRLDIGTIFCYQKTNKNAIQSHIMPFGVTSMYLYMIALSSNAHCKWMEFNKRRRQCCCCCCFLFSAFHLHRCHSMVIHAGYTWLGCLYTIHRIYIWLHK